MGSLVSLLGLCALCFIQLMSFELFTSGQLLKLFACELHLCQLILLRFPSLNMFGCCLRRGWLDVLVHVLNSLICPEARSSKANDYENAKYDDN